MGLGTVENLGMLKNFGTMKILTLHGDNEMSINLTKNTES